MSIPLLPSLNPADASFKLDVDTFFLTQLPATVAAMNSELERVAAIGYGSYTATSVTEIMGMYGRPTAMKGKLTGVKRPEAPSPDHPIRLLGQSHLASDPSVVNAVAYHQMKFIKGGIDVLTNAYFPTATPQELVDGHSVHMGIEFSNLFWNVAKK